MAFSVAPQLWDNLLTVLSSLTLWKEVVIQWKVYFSHITCLYMYMYIHMYIILKMTIGVGIVPFC